MTVREFAGTVQGGKFQPSNAPGWLVALGALEGKRVIVTIQTEKRVRSLKANARYWSLIVPCVAEVLTQLLPPGELPVSRDEAHERLKEHFIGFTDTPLGRIPKHSKLLDSAAFADYCNRIEGWLAEAYNVFPDQMMDL